MFTDRECLQSRREFPSLRRRQGGHPIACLDGPAGTQVPSRVIDAVRDYYLATNANAFGGYPASSATDDLMRRAREWVAALLGAASWRSISFGQNMTTLTFALSRALAAELSSGDEIVITELDHEANRGPWLRLTGRGVAVREVTLQPDGRLDPEDLERKIGERTRIVAIGLASNALGTVNDVGRARRLASEAGALLVVDAVHHAAHFPIDVGTLDPDFLLCSAYKFYGPHVGILYSRPGLLDRLDTDRLRTQKPDAPYRVETGTLNHAAVAGVAAAIEFLASWGEGTGRRERLVTAMEAISDYEHGVAAHYFDRVSRIDGVTAWGPDFSTRPRAPTVSITIDGVAAGEAARRLGEKGIEVRGGHFYALRAVEVLGLASRGGVLRAGFMMYNPRQEADRLVQAVAELAEGAL